MKTNMRKREWILLGCIAACMLGIILWMRSGTPAVTVRVVHEQRTVLEFDPQTDALYHVEGDCGGLDIEVKNGRWHVIHEQCPNHICALTGWADAENLKIITCLPNRIVIQIGEYSHGKQ